MDAGIVQQKLGKAEAELLVGAALGSVHKDQAGGAGALTPNLLNYAGIDREVMIVGRAGQAEIWDAREFERFEMENLTPEKLLASLEAIGL